MEGSLTPAVPGAARGALPGSWLQTVLALLSLVFGVIGVLLFPFFGIGLYPALLAGAAGMASLAIGARRGARLPAVALTGLTLGAAPWAFLVGWVWVHAGTLETTGDLVGLIVATIAIPAVEGLAIRWFLRGRRQRRLLARAS